MNELFPSSRNYIYLYSSLSYFQSASRPQLVNTSNLSSEPITLYHIVTTYIAYTCTPIPTYTSTHNTFKEKLHAYIVITYVIFLYFLSRKLITNNVYIIQNWYNSYQYKVNLIQVQFFGFNQQTQMQIGIFFPTMKHFFCDHKQYS
jgi:hypothetical protein